MERSSTNSQWKANYPPEKFLREGYLILLLQDPGNSAVKSWESTKRGIIYVYQRKTRHTLYKLETMEQEACAEPLPSKTLM